MKLDVFIERENKKEKVELPEGSTLKDLLTKLKINPVTVVISKNGEVVAEIAKIKDKDKIELLSVVSGG
ncbi:MAG: sulfur carrier protein ThiS [Candidatus Nanoarchaeia archaeon]|nr:sulfur carrier protein ThiS [Candidatus Nanoarchaeia archaeon]